MIQYKTVNDNKNKICNDKLLKNYEKIFLFIDIYYLGILDHPDHIVDYCHMSDAEKDSPLYFAKEFLECFIKELDYDSCFYYPLLLIDAEKFTYKYVNDHFIKFITTYGFSMLPIEEIKNHLVEMIPNIILFSKFLNEDQSAITNPITGNIFLNKFQFQEGKILKNVHNHPNSNYSFIVSKTFMHELFGHKNSSYSKAGINYHSIISFKNKDGELNLISGNECDLFIDAYKINSETIDEYKGDSGYLFEYFLRKIGNEYTLSLIDTVEIKFNLIQLLNPELWHRDLKTFQEYVKLVVIIANLLPDYCDKIDGKKDAKTQLKEMKLEVMKEIKGEEVKNNITEKKINEIIDEKFNENVRGFRKKRILKFEKERTMINNWNEKNTGVVRSLILAKVKKRNNH